jgi:hypothetical protein
VNYQVCGSRVHNHIEKSDSDPDFFADPDFFGFIAHELTLIEAGDEAAA